MAKREHPALRSSIASGSVGRARQRTHKWRTDCGRTFPVTVRKVATA